LDHVQLTDWIAGYERAWRASGTEALAELFSEDASYSTAPYESTHRGLDAIREMWDAERLGPGEEFEMTSKVVAIEGSTGVARIEVHYREPKNKEYRDLWIVTLDDDGRCINFEEWPFWPPDQLGAPAAGA
jgi:hypothetical protein